MGSINKATVAALVGAIGTIVTAFLDVPEEVIAGVTATAVAFFVWLVPNKSTI